MIRISVGLENLEDIVEDIENALALSPRLIPHSQLVLH
jgi:Cys/Met metabolism PLP-dependent enzyme.